MFGVPALISCWDSSHTNSEFYACIGKTGLKSHATITQAGREPLCTKSECWRMLTYAKSVCWRMLTYVDWVYDTEIANYLEIIHFCPSPQGSVLFSSFTHQRRSSFLVPQGGSFKPQDLDTFFSSASGFGSPSKLWVPPAHPCNCTTNCFKTLQVKQICIDLYRLRGNRLQCSTAETENHFFLSIFFFKNTQEGWAGVGVQHEILHCFF